MESELGEWQSEFRIGRGTSDLIFVMKMIMEKNWEWGIDKIVLFVDIEKAFDCVLNKYLGVVIDEGKLKLMQELRNTLTNSRRCTHF